MIPLVLPVDLQRQDFCGANLDLAATLEPHGLVPALIGDEWRRQQAHDFFQPCRLHHHQVEHPVPAIDHRRQDEGTGPGAEVRDMNGRRPFLKDLPVDLDLEIMVGDRKSLRRAYEVGETTETPFEFAPGPANHVGIETNSDTEQKHVVRDPAHIDADRYAGLHQGERAIEQERDSQRPREHISAAPGNGQQRPVTADEPARRSVHGSVTTNDHDWSTARMFVDDRPGIVVDAGLYPVWRQPAMTQREPQPIGLQKARCRRARDGVDDDEWRGVHTVSRGGVPTMVRCRTAADILGSPVAPHADRR